jgi:Fe-S cluster assembly protein SufD
MSALPNFQESVFMNSVRAAFTAQAKPTVAQSQAWNTFLLLGLPALRAEQWKYTQLHRLYSQSFVAAEELSGESSNNSVSVINGRLSSTIPAVLGLTIRSLASSSIETTEPFVALNYALTPNEIVIEVADNTVVEQPFIVEVISSGTASSIVAPRITIKLGRHSKLSLIERHRNIDAVSHTDIAVTKIVLDENAWLEHCLLQNENSASFHIGNINAVVGRHAQYLNHHFNLGGSLGRIDLNVQLQGAESYTELNGLQFATGTQVHDTHSRIEHCVPYARSSETYHGIADERGQVVFNGKVLVHKHAIGTDAKQSSRNLLLSPKAEIDTKPELEIYADDVKCSHGATVGQLDSNALFYLRSRGIAEQQARALLTVAFADAVINKVPLVSLREELTQQVHARFNSITENVP